MANPSKRAEARHPSGKKGAVESPDKVLARKIRSAVEQKEIIKRTTVGMYTLQVPEGFMDTTIGVKFGIPFFALTDALALKAQKELLPTSNLYRVGSFCLYDGKTTSCSPALVLDTKVS